MTNRAVGVVAEFDPFHKGHHYLLSRIRSRFPDRGLVCVISGSFTQRGTAASLDKSLRARMALEGGADLMLELPVLWSAASAERFARGGVGVLLDTGLVDTIAFGSESGELEVLRDTASAIDSPQFQTGLRAGLEEGLSYAAARQRTVTELIGEKARCLAEPNNNLAVEYLRALAYWRSPGVSAFTVARLGAGHDSRESDAPAVSASLLRDKMERRDWAGLAAGLPESSFRLLSASLDRGEGTADLRRCQLALLARLRTMEEKDFARLPDFETGLENRLARAAGEAETLEELYDLAKTRRYPEARVRRMVLWAFLGLEDADRQDRVPYLRVLGANERGRELLREMKQSARQPVITRAGQIRSLDREAQRVFRLEARAADLRALCLPEGCCRRGGVEWSRQTVILPGQAD